ncbi:MAG: SDR family NAD(P)-dependent oxidoreductase [Sphingobium sp.]|nr:SDR family NAD(P)-dependent oxidoreductase [Sphingobium sp.]
MSKSDEAKTIVLFGGGGFLGRAVAQELFARGCRVRIAQRAPRLAYAVRALGGLGYSQFAACDITDAADVARVMQGATAAVNLVGLLKGDMKAAHVTGARNVAEAAAAAGLDALVQVSAIGADPESASAYGSTKGQGEAAVRAAFPAATIVRPSILFGRDDQFTNRFARLVSAAPVVPVIRGGAKFQPASVADVARAIALAVTHPEKFGGTTYELGGPDVLTMAEIMRWIAKQAGRNPSFVPLPDPAARLMAILTGWAPGAPITIDQYKMLLGDTVVSAGAKGFEAFNIRPAPMAALASAWLTQYRKHGRFAEPVST